jgi:arylsulfatase A-like enzyme
VCSVKKCLKPVEVLREGWRSALLGALCGYVFLAYFYLSSWISSGAPLGWSPVVNGFWGVLRNLSAALFFYPAVGLAVNLVVGALTTLVTGLIGLDEERRRRVGVVAVGIVAFAVLGLPFAVSWLFTRYQFTIGYAVKLVLGAGFVWAALRWERIVRLVARAAGYVLAGAAVLWVLFAFVFQGLFSPGEPGAVDPPGPNVVVILSDAHRADVESLYGGEVPTPNIEELAERGVTFERCFSPSNWTIPSVASLFTGLAPEVTGMDSYTTRMPGVRYLPEELSSLGYRTWAMIGNPVLSSKAGFDRGFDHYAAVFYEYFYGQGFLTAPKTSFYSAGAYLVNKVIRDNLYEHTVALGPEDALMMLRAMSDAGGDFIYIHILDPHDRYKPPERYLVQTEYEGRYERDSGGFLYYPDELTGADIAQLKRLYEGEVRLVDEFVGEALSVLDAGGHWGNTVVLFLSDHGEEFKEHGDIVHGRANLHHELTHVPLVVYWPGRLEGGARVGTPVSLCDLYPTILDGLGLEYEEGAYNGRSLFELTPSDRPVFSQRCSDKPDNPYYRSDLVVRGDAALFLDYVDGAEELYVDYYGNPRNVAGEHRELVLELKGLLEEWHARNDELVEHHGTAATAGTVDAAQLEKLRALGYLQ